MALINSGQIELLDLTDTRAAILTLNTSLPKLQVQQSNGNFSPDFEKSSGKVPEYDSEGFPTGNNRDAEQGLHIYPSLYFGQELISINNYASLIKYTIEGVTGSFQYEQDSQNNDIYVNIYGELIYKKNLTEDNLTITAEIEKYDVGIEHYEDIIGRIELTKITPDSNYLPIITYNKNIFSSYDKDPIRLTASLYRGGECLTSGVSYNWHADSAAIKIEKVEAENVVEISRDQIINVATIFCDCIVTSLNKVYTTQVTISDTTDPLFSQIISSKGLVFTGSEDETELTCDIYRGTELINREGSSFKYSWSYLQEGSTKFEPIEEESTSRTIQVFPQQINANSVTYRCEASNDVEKTVAQIAIIISPEFKAIVNPVQSFINTKHDGSLTDDAEIEVNGEKKKGFTRTILFKVVDGKGTVLDINNLEVFPQIDLQTGEDDPFSFECKKEENKTWKINMTFIDISSEEEDYSFFAQRLANSTLFTIEYDYKNIQLSEEFYLIKNIQGAAGEEILESIQLYALGEYIKEKGFYYDKIVTSEEGKNLYFIIDNKERYLFNDNGDLNYKRRPEVNEQGELTWVPILFEKVYFSDGVTNLMSEVIFTEFKTKVFGLLELNKASWATEIPKIPLSTEILTSISDFPNTDDGTILLQGVGEILQDENNVELTNQKFYRTDLFHSNNSSLWLKTKYIWDSNQETFSTILLAESLKDLQITSTYSETLYENNSIRSIVSTVDWIDKTNSRFSSVEQTANDITMTFRDYKEDFDKFIKFGNGTILLGEQVKKDQDSYATLIDNEGFYTLYLPANTENQIKTGAFDRRGLSTKEISLRIDHSADSQDSIIISKGTPTGGWVWTKGSRRRNNEN